MHAEDFVVNNRSQGKVIKNVCAVPPDVCGTILPQALIVKAVDLCNLSRLMVAPNKRNSFGIPDFKSQQKQEGFNAVVSSVDKVTHK
jgi:hypothetical protein